MVKTALFILFGLGLIFIVQTQINLQAWNPNLGPFAWALGLVLAMFPISVFAKANPVLHFLLGIAAFVVTAFIEVMSGTLVAAVWSPVIGIAVVLMVGAFLIRAQFVAQTSSYSA